MIDMAASHAFTCFGKVRYTERRWAKKSARMVRKRGGDLLSVYRCTACGLWHLGHKPKEWS